MVLWSRSFTCRCCGMRGWLAGLMREVAFVHRAEGPTYKAKERSQQPCTTLQRACPALLHEHNGGTSGQNVQPATEAL